MLAPLLQDHGPEEVGAGVAVISQDAPPPISAVIFEEFIPTAVATALEEDLVPQQAPAPPPMFLPLAMVAEDTPTILDEASSPFVMPCDAIVTSMMLVSDEVVFSSSEETTSPTMSPPPAPFVVSPPAFDELVGPTVDDETVQFSSITIDTTVMPSISVPEETVSAIDEEAPLAPAMVAAAAAVNLFVVDEEAVAPGIDEVAQLVALTVPSDIYQPWMSIDEEVTITVSEAAELPIFVQAPLDTIVFALPVEEHLSAVVDEEFTFPNVPQLLEVTLFSIVNDEELGHKPTPPPPPKPKQQSAGGPAVGAGSGYWAPEQPGPEWCWDPKTLSYKRILDLDACPPKPPMEATGNAGDTETELPPLVDLVIPGVANFIGTKLAGDIGKKVAGKHGAAVGVVGSFITTLVSKKHKRRAASVIGSGLAALDSLMKLYSDDSPSSSKPGLRFVDRNDFVARVRALHSPVRVQHVDRELERAGKKIRVILIAYVIEGEPGVLWCYREARQYKPDGSVDLSTTLLRRMRRRRRR